MQVLNMCIFYNYQKIIYYMGDKMGIAFRKKTEKKYIQYTIRIEEPILDDIRAIAKEENLSINEIINQCLSFAIENYKK